MQLIKVSLLLIFVALLSPGIYAWGLFTVYPLYLLFSATLIGSITGLALIWFVGWIIYLCVIGKVNWE